MASNILNFSPDRIITGINVIDGMLFYTDNENEPKKINIEKFKGNFEGVEVDHSSGTTHIYGRQMREGDITVVKDHPIAPMTTQKFDEPFGTGVNDLTIASVSEGKNTGVDKNGNEIINPSEGNADINIDSHSTSNTSFTGRLLLNEGQLVEGGFIWSATEKTLESLVNGRGSSSTEIVSKNINLGGGVAIIQETIQSTSSSSGNYNAALATGEIYVVSFGKKKGNSTRFYSSVAQAKILNSAASGSAPSGLVPAEPKIIENTVQIESDLSVDGNVEILNSGLYVSEGRINDNETAPTVQELINNGNVIPAVFEPKTKKIIASFNTVPNLIYYYTPFVTNKNGTVYGNDLATSGTVTTKVQNKTKKVAPVVTGDVTEHSNTSAVITSFSNGNDYLKPFRYEEITELGFYFSTNEYIKEDILLKSFTNNVSADGKTFKVAVTTDYNKGGKFSLNTASHLTLLNGEELCYFAYNVSGGVENTGDKKTFKLPEYPKDPIFEVTESNWGFETPYALSSSGTRNIDVDFTLDILSKPNKNTTTITDCGFIISKPVTKEEIERSKDGVWDTIADIVDPNNTLTITIPKSDLTFTPNAGDSDIGRYTNTNPIIIPSITAEEYNNLISENIKISTPSFRVVGYMIGSDGVTRYTKPFGDSKVNNVNPPTKSEFTKTTIGSPQIIFENSSKEFITVKEDDRFTVTAKVHKDGKRIAEVGAYVSTTPPPDITILPDGRSPGLDAWAATATKRLATESVSTINNHINQNVNEYLDVNISCGTGLTPGTEHYVCVYTLPETTASTTLNNTVVNGSEPLIDLLNNKKWSGPKKVTTLPNISAVDVDPEIVIIDDGSIKDNLTKTSVTVKCKAVKTSPNYSIAEIGVYLKPASEFSNPFSDQSGNAATMASATNRIEKKLVLTNIKEQGKNEEINFTADVTGITTVEYYASTFVTTNTNGNIQTFISPYISIDNSVNNLLLPIDNSASFMIEEFNAFTNDNVPSSANSWGAQRRNNILAASANWTFGMLKPEIINFGFYFLENQSLAMPASPSEFMEEYNSPSSGTTKYNATQSVSTQTSLETYKKGYRWTLPLPFNINFPTPNADKFYYVVAFYETVDNVFGFSGVERVYVLNPTKNVERGMFQITRSSIDEILYRNDKVSGFRVGGIFFPKNKKYDYIDVDINTAGLPDNWFIQIPTSPPGPESNSWPAPIVRNNNSVRIYTPPPGTNRRYVVVSIVLKSEGFNFGYEGGRQRDRNNSYGSMGLSHSEGLNDILCNIVLRWYG